MKSDTFDYESFAKKMANQANNVIPGDISNNGKKYIVNIIYNHCRLAGEALANDSEVNLDAEQAGIVCQFIGEWGFHKSIDTIRGNIPPAVRDDLLQKVAFTIFEVAKLALDKGMPLDDIIELVEEQVEKCFSEELTELHKQGKISQSEFENTLKQSNLKRMAAETSDDRNFLLIVLNDYLLLYLAFAALFIFSFRYGYIAVLIEIIGISIVTAALTFYVSKKRPLSSLTKKVTDNKPNAQYYVNTDEMYTKLGVDILCFHFGDGLLSMADPDEKNQVLPKIGTLRQEIIDELGFIIPNVRLMDSPKLKDNEYSVLVRGNAIANGFVYPDKYMVIAKQWGETGRPIPINAVVDVDPTYKTQVYWLNKEQIPTDDDITAIAAVDVIMAHLKEICIKYVDKIITKADVLKMMELVKSQDKTLVDDLVPKLISVMDLRKILVNLIREKVSIKDIMFIFECLNDYARFSKKPDTLSERLRAALGTQICFAHATENKVIYALPIAQEWEDFLTKSLVETDIGSMFLLKPEEIQQFIETTTSTLMRAQQTIGKQPIILCSPRIRLPLYQLLERHIPTITVISYMEITTEISVDDVDTIEW